VALKLSLYPWDRRFAREAQLLARLSHPSIPALLGSGVLRSPTGAKHPWVAMQWVEGTPLYAWATQHSPSHRQVCLLLGQLARALEVLHASGAVHRDVKGDNVLVRHSDGRPVLIDFGSCHFQGAPRLTWQSLPPGTPAYLSAQACLFDIRLARDRNSYYAPTPADDLFALGVTAYRLVMGDYPPAMNVQEDEQGNWRVASPDPRPLLQNNPRVQPFLREWIHRLLSDVPQERGSAAALAEAMEAEGQEPVQSPQPVVAPAADMPPPVAPATVSASEGQDRSRAQRRPWAFRPWLAVTAAVVVAVVVPLRQLPPGCLSPEDVSERTATGRNRETSAPRDSTPPIPSKQPRTQAQPDATGQCPVSKHVLFNGFCWVEQASMTAEECTRSGYMPLEGKCYAPVLDLPQKPVPTSSPGDAR
jgi:serine/threonine protein kinase